MVHVVLLVQEKHSCPPVEHSVVSVVLDATIFLASLALCTMVGPTLCLVLVLSFICTPKVNTFFYFRKYNCQIPFFFCLHINTSD